MNNELNSVPIITVTPDAACEKNTYTESFTINIVPYPRYYYGYRKFEKTGRKKKLMFNIIFITVMMIILFIIITIVCGGSCL